MPRSRLRSLPGCLRELRGDDNISSCVFIAIGDPKQQMEQAGIMKGGQASKQEDTGRTLSLLTKMKRTFAGMGVGV